MSSLQITGDNRLEWAQQTSVSKKHVMAHIGHLPEEVILLIFGQLAFLDLVSVKAVCRSWSQLAQDDQLWKKFFFTVFRRSIFSAIEQKGNLSFHDSVIRQGRIERALVQWPRDRIDPPDPVSIGMGNFGPMKVVLQGNKIYFCEQRYWNFFPSDPNILCVIDRTSLQRERIPLAIQREGISTHQKQNSIEAFDAEYLVTRCKMKKIDVFFQRECEKFYVYHGKTKQLLWGGEDNELCAEIRSSVRPLWIFSKVHSQDKKSWMINISNLRAERGYNLTQKSWPYDFKCALSGVAHYSMGRSNYVIYITSRAKGGWDVNQVKCRLYSNINEHGALAYQRLDGEVFLLTPGELGYTKISLGNIAAARFFLTLDSLWAIGSRTMTKLNLESGGSWTIPKAYRDSEVAIYENYFIEVGWRRASSITILHPKTGQTMERENGIESIVYFSQTLKKVLDEMCLSRPTLIYPAIS